MVMMPDAPTVQMLSSGVALDRLMPGGRDGPDDIVLNSQQPGGGVWTEMFFIGAPDDPWRLGIPDIRMARNQIWPLHWHDCWIAVIILDGSCLVGDWWMQRGDVVITPAKVEYGPLLNGPNGCQMLEVFARDIYAAGGYAPEYHDHPTLTYLQSLKSAGPAQFLPRPKVSEGNAGSQTTPLATVPGVVTGSLGGNQRFDLGEPDDPERGVLLDTTIPPNVVIPSHHHRDWRGVLIWEGSMRVGNEPLTKDDLLIIEPNAEVGAFETGAEGVHLLEFAKTDAAVPTVFRQHDLDDPAYGAGLGATSDSIFE
jgi:hypothetical protein